MTSKLMSKLTSKLKKEKLIKSIIQLTDLTNKSYRPGEDKI